MAWVHPACFTVLSVAWYVQSCLPYNRKTRYAVRLTAVIKKMASRVSKFLCPQCGRDLKVPDRTSLFLCRHCDIRLVLYRDTLIRCGVQWYSGWGGDLVYMPFWYLNLESGGIKTVSRAGGNSRNPGRARDPENPKTSNVFVPAFRVQSDVFLQSAEVLGRHDEGWNLEPGMPPSARRFPVTVSVNDADRILPSLIRRLASLPELSNSTGNRPIHVREIRLVYIPFQRNEKEWVQDRLQLVIPLSAFGDTWDSVR